jgi:site-specific DNA-cytosine methylase
MNVLSLFDGMSCGQIALKRVGLKVSNYYASEIDKNAISITQHNFPSTIQLGDVTKIKAEDLPDIDLLIGGSPCQGFSFAGKQLNFEDPRSKLFFDFLRLLEDTLPRYFLLENVKMKKEHQDVISKYLGVQPIRVNSNLVSAQDRVRYYWTNIKGFEQPKDKGLYLRDVLDLEVPDKYEITKRFYAKKEGTLAFTKSRANLRREDQKSKTLLTGGHGISNTGSTNVYISDNYIRVPTPLECERLQTVPEGYTSVPGLIDSKRYHALGNGWTVDAICEFFKHIPKDLELL